MMIERLQSVSRDKHRHVPRDQTLAVGYKNDALSVRRESNLETHYYISRFLLSAAEREGGNSCGFCTFKAVYGIILVSHCLPNPIPFVCLSVSWSAADFRGAKHLNFALRSRHFRLLLLLPEVSPNRKLRPDARPDRADTGSK